MGVSQDILSLLLTFFFLLCENLSSSKLKEEPVPASGLVTLLSPAGTKLPGWTPDYGPSVCVCSLESWQEMRKPVGSG